MWVQDAGVPGVTAVEGPVTPGKGHVTAAVDPGARVAVTATNTPWNVVPITPASAAKAALCRVMTAELGRSQARQAPDREGYLRGASGEKILSVRVHDQCNHPSQHWEPRSCGHVWCKMCNGFVHPGTKVALKGPVDVIRCNRHFDDFGKYDFLFKECNAGSANLTKTMRKALGKERVAPPEDIL